MCNGGWVHGSCYLGVKRAFRFNHLKQKRLSIFITVLLIIHRFIDLVIQDKSGVVSLGNSLSPVHY